MEKTRTLLSKEQQDYLKEYGWDVIPDGNYITFDKEEHDEKFWEELCKVTDMSIESKTVTMLFIGVQ